MPSTRTPEGEPDRCPICGKRVVVEVARPPGDSTCSHCGALLWPIDNRGPNHTARLGRFGISRELGRGGMGTVYEGIDEKLDRKVAIEVFSQLPADKHLSQQHFFQEAKVLANLSHPCIVQTYDAGEQHGQMYYVMEFVGYRTLEDELRGRQRLGTREVVAIGIDMAQAVRYLHDHGIIHRNVSPSNMIRSEDGRVKLTGFGIAQMFVMPIRNEGDLIGSMEFMAPEQCEGTPVSNRTDCYGLGATMFKLLSGRAPFVGHPVAAMFQLRHEQAPSVREFVPDVPANLDQLIAELLKTDPQDRVPTALILENRLRAIQASMLDEDIT